MGKKGFYRDESERKRQKKGTGYVGERTTNSEIKWCFVAPLYFLRLKHGNLMFGLYELGKFGKIYETFYTVEDGELYCGLVGVSVMFD